MVKATVIDTEKVPGVDRIRVKGIVVFGYRESLLPRDVGLKTIDFIHMTPMSFVDGVPAGSISYKGSPVTYGGPDQGRLSGRPGSPATLIWRVGSLYDGSPWRSKIVTLGSAATGSKSAFFDIVGK